MTKKTKKPSLGKRLWHAITEPIPDDDDDEQTTEQIPLAYDLKKDESPTSTQATRPAGEGDIQDPAFSAQTSQAESQASAPAKSQGKSAVASQSTATSAQSAVTSTPTTRAQAKAARQAAKAAQTTTAASQSAKNQPEPASSQVVSQAAKSTAAKHQSQAAAKTVHSQATATSQGSAAARPTSAKTSTPVTRKTDQPVISINATEQDSDEETPELPLSREALYGDQQPNGGSAAPRKNRETVDVEALSRVARHNESSAADLDTDDTTDNPHLKKKTTGSSRPHQKPQRRNGKLTAIGIGLLVIAALGAMFMFKHAKTTEANAKAAAETAVSAIYTSSAQRDIRASASDAEITQLQTAIDGMKQSDEKQTLQTEHDNAAKMIKVRSRYQGLYNSANLIKASVTVADVTAAQTALTNSSLKTAKTYFTKRYTQKFTATSKIVKPVRKYDAEYQALYTSKKTLKSSVSTLELDAVIKKLKPYRQQSALAKTDYETLTAERKALAKKEQSAATSAANAVSSSYSAPAASSSVESSSSSTVYSSATSSTTTGNDTQSSSATASSSTYGTSTTESSTTTGTGSSTTTGNGTGVSGYSATTTN